MPSSNPSLRAAETSEELEIFCAHSVNYSDKAAKILLDAIGQLNVGLDTLTMLAGGGGHDQCGAGSLFLRISWPARKGAPVMQAYSPEG